MVVNCTVVLAVVGHVADFVYSGHGNVIAGYEAAIVAVGGWFGSIEGSRLFRCPNHIWKP